MVDEIPEMIPPGESELAEQVLENARLLAERRLSRALNALPLEERAKRVGDHVVFIGRTIAREVSRLTPDLIEIGEQRVRCAETGRSISVLCEDGRVLIARSWLSGHGRCQAVEELQVDDDMLYVRLASGDGEWASLWELVGEILED